MENFNITCLTCGYNGTGSSALISCDRAGSGGSHQILDRLLINCGDGVQRFCNENHIKLSKVSCIIITSLAPHNISGFAGVFLSLSEQVGDSKLY